MSTEQEPHDDGEARHLRGPVRRWMRARPADVIDVFVSVTGLVVTLLASGAAVRRLLHDEPALP